MGERMQQRSRYGSGRSALPGDLDIPEQARSLVLFAHGSGSSRLSSRNRWVAEVLQRASTGDAAVRSARRRRGGRPAQRVRHRTAQRSVSSRPWTGLRGRLRWRAWASGCSVPAPAPPPRCARRPRGPAAWRRWCRAAGGPTWPASSLPRVSAPTLLIVGGADREVLELNRQALRAIALQQAAGDRARGDAPVRGTRRAEQCGRTCCLLVRDPSRPRAPPGMSPAWPPEGLIPLGDRPQDVGCTSERALCRSCRGRPRAGRAAAGAAAEPAVGRAGAAARRRAGRCRGGAGTEGAARPAAGAQDRRSLAARAGAGRRGRGRTAGYRRRRGGAAQRGRGRATTSKRRRSSQLREISRQRQAYLSGRPGVPRRGPHRDRRRRRHRHRHHHARRAEGAAPPPSGRSGAGRAGGAARHAEALRPEVDQLVCLATPHPFFAVGEHYVRFHQVDDDEVIEALDAAAIAPKEG